MDTIASWLRAQPDLDPTDRRIVDVCEADLIGRGSGAIDGRVDRPTWDVLCLIAGRFADRTGHREEWRP